LLPAGTPDIAITQGRRFWALSPRGGDTTEEAIDKLGDDAPVDHTDK